MFPRMDDLRKYGRMSNVKRLALIAEKNFKQDVSLGSAVNIILKDISI